jgi:hypothetical protein
MLDILITSLYSKSILMMVNVKTCLYIKVVTLDGTIIHVNLSPYYENGHIIL